MNFKTFVALCLMCCLNDHSRAQNSNIDSLENLLVEVPRKQKVDVLCKLSIAYRSVDNERALYYASQGLRIAKTDSDYVGVARSALIAAKAYKEMGQMDEAIALYEAVLPICRDKGLVNEEILIMNGYALALTHKALYDKALKLHFEALVREGDIHDSLSMGITLNNVGLVYYKLKQYRKALHYFERCYALKRRFNDSFDMDLLLINKGLCYAYLRQYEEAEEFVNRGVAMCETNCGRRTMEAMFAKGVIRHGKLELQKADIFFRESLSRAKTLNDIRFQLDNYYYLAEIRMMQSNPKAAAIFLKSGEELVRDHQAFNLERIKLYSRLAQLYRTLGDFRTASDYQLEYMNLKDVIYSEELTSNLMRIEAEHLERENLSKIASQQDVILVNQEIIQSQKKINRLLILVSIVAAGLVATIFRNYRLKKKANALLDTKVEERTRALLLHDGLLMKNITERDLMLRRTVSSFTASLNAIEGLCLTGLQEVHDSLGRTYLLKIEGVAHEARRLNACI